MSAICTGTVRHRRFAPKEHWFTYPVFMALLDLDRVKESMAGSWLLGFNRFAWASYDDRDHLGNPARPLKERLRSDAEAQGFTFPAGRVLLLANLRFWGFCFNPVSYVYAFDTQDRLALIGAEVTNTPWRERIVYWMKVPKASAPGNGVAEDPQHPQALPSLGRSMGRDGSVSRAWSFDVPKAMHVSPFMPMDLRYRWTFTLPDEALKVRMALFQGQELLFDAGLDLTCRPWTAREIRRTLLAFPFHTLKVISAIHWEALKLWFKRVPVFTHPAKAPSPGRVS